MCFSSFVLTSLGTKTEQMPILIYSMFAVWQLSIKTICRFLSSADGGTPSDAKAGRFRHTRRRRYFRIAFISSGFSVTVPPCFAYLPSQAYLSVTISVDRFANTAMLEPSRDS
jgi:hypothetical protein